MHHILITLLILLGCTSVNAQTFTTYSVPAQGGSGSSMIDYDGDGNLDVYITIGNNLNNVLLQNDGLGNLSMIANHPLVQQTNWDTQSSTWADFDNDGDLDVFMPTGGSGNVPVQYNLFFENLGGGNFVSVSVGGPTDYQVKSNSTGTADYDNDGLLDILLCARDDNDSLFKNNGALNFSSVNTPIDDISSWSTNTLFSDLDNDGDQDAIRIHRWQPSAIFENQNGTFVENTPSALSSMSNVRSVEAKDFDNDGDFDLLVGSRAFGYAFLQNNGGFNFTNVTSTHLPVHLQTANSSTSGDVDNDGDLDIYTAAFLAPSQLWLNNGNGIFSTTASSINLQATTDGPSMGDLNGDGKLDLYVPIWNSNNAYFINTTTNGNNYVQIELEGLISNKSAIGAKIKAYFNLFGNQVWRVREVQALSQKQGQNDLAQHFGVGGATHLDSLVIEWPSGLVCKYADLATNQDYYFQEVCCDSLPSPLITETVDTSTAGLIFQHDVDSLYFMGWLVKQQWCANSDTGTSLFIDPTLFLEDTAQFTYYSVSLVTGNVCIPDTFHVLSESKTFDITSTIAPCKLSYYAPSGLDPAWINWYVDGQFVQSGSEYWLETDRDTAFVLDLVYSAPNCTDTITENIDYTITPLTPTTSFNFENEGCYTTLSLNLTDADLIDFYALDQGVNVAPNQLQYPFIPEGSPIEVCYVFNTGLDPSGQYPCPNDTICESLVGTGVKEPLYMPNVFSPNADQRFDELIVKNDCFGLVQLSIQNRWGVEVFSGQVEPDGEISWNGLILNTGEEAPEGTYFYILELDKQVYSTGTINLFR